MGGNQAGIIGVLSILSKGHKILSAVSYSDNLTELLKQFNIIVYKSINDRGFDENLVKSDILICVHGREKVKRNFLKLPKYGAINIHPYLYKYKGTYPVKRALEDGNFKASVGAHIMDEAIDRGKVLIEEFLDVSGSKSIEEIYNKLYPSYCKVILKSLNIIYDYYKK
jgi:methionyl-tRNA formyltransferase